MQSLKGAGALNSYKQVAVQTELSSASPHRIIQMLMESALDKLAKAKGLIQNKKITEKGNQIGLVVSIIDVLRASLDHEVGGEISQNLDALYDYMLRRLTEANVSNDINILDEVSKLLREIKIGWDAIPEDIRSAHEQQQLAESKNQATGG